MPSKGKKKQKNKTLAGLKSGAEISLVCLQHVDCYLGKTIYKIFLSSFSSMFARPITSQLKDKGLEKKKLQIQEIELSDWNGASVCTNPLMDY